MTFFMVIEESDFPPDRIGIVDGSGWSNPSEPSTLVREGLFHTLD